MEESGFYGNEMTPSFSNAASDYAFKNIIFYHVCFQLQAFILRHQWTVASPSERGTSPVAVFTLTPRRALLWEEKSAVPTVIWTGALATGYIQMVTILSEMN